MNGSDKVHEKRGPMVGVRIEIGVPERFVANSGGDVPTL